VRIFVVGGAGYVGSHCVKRLVAAGHQVTVYDNLCAGHRQAVDRRARFVEGDLADSARLDEVFKAAQCDAAMHFAAFLNVSESVNEPLKYWQNNVAHTLNLLTCMQRYDVRRFVFSSSCAVYGVPDELPIREDQPRRPISPYGTTKLAVEWMLEQSAAAWGLGAVALRYFNAAGAAADGTMGEDHDPEIHLIPIVLQVALGQRESVKVFGGDYPTPDGTCIRDYIHVDDLAEAHLLALEHCTPGCYEAFNVGTGTGTSVLEIIAAGREVTGHPIHVVVGERRTGDPPVLFADASRMRKQLGWTPQHLDIHDVIGTSWQWHRSHPRGYV
jgi:UDP-glucose 4-epimerase